jgi:phosphohistidine swiveling domain-containing protein
MKKINIKNLIKKLPPDMSRHASRDLCVLTSAIFGETHTVTMKKEFKANFSTTFWRMKKDKHIILYRLQQEYDHFSEVMGERCRNERYAKKIADNLMQMTDWINNFIKDHRELADFMTKSRLFITAYRDYFGYHQAVYWSGDYLAKGPWQGDARKSVQKTINLLRRAYKYNELIVPRVERYFSKLKIDHLLPEEINKNVKKNIKQKPKRRSVFFLDKQRYVLLPTNATKLEQAILDKSDTLFKRTKVIKGICAQSGRYKGKARVVKNLYKLKQCRPGEVLVTFMTRPQINSVIKKVGAIITDEGGILSHAAILAREFKIPCVVGTKIATKVFKDGDKVDANHGIVRKL